MARTTYSTHGSVRGSCGHEHRSVEAAARCLRKDMADCVSVGGYSDRSVVASDDEPLDDYDDALVRAIVNGEHR
jgi:hypothetical protein